MLVDPASLMESGEEIVHSRVKLDFVVEQSQKLIQEMTGLLV